MEQPGLESHIGSALFIRTVTNYFTGHLVGITKDQELVLVDAAWIPVTGRFGTMMAGGPDMINEVEPYPADMHVYVNREAIVDWVCWPYPLPREQKP